MLRVVSHESAAAARQYYTEGLKREDYYSEGQEVVGKWHGKAAERLGLSGDVDPGAFAALLENRHPTNGERLTPRTKAQRRVGYDLNFHAPKSLSVLHALTGDDDILKAFRAAVQETMRELEQRAETRVRRSGNSVNRTTGNLVWAEFVHFTARPVGGIPDPHLHVHNFAFNATFDPVEERWKAAQYGEIKRDAPYSEAAFHARLAAKLTGIGYGVRRTKSGWEIIGVPQEVIDKFSRRTAQIERVAEDRGITDAKLKDGLGAATREGKRHGMTYPELLGAWGVRLSEQEKIILSKVRFDRGGGNPEKISPAEALDYATDKLFQRSSVVAQRRLVAEALRFGVGRVTPEQIWRELARREMVTAKIGDEIMCTSLSVLAEEVALIDHVRNGRGTSSRLGTGKIAFGNPRLSAEQKGAVGHVLNSRDQVIAIRGGAGVGKTTLMRETVDQIEASGIKVFAFAPSAAASRETLRESGFAGAETVAHLLLNKNLQRQTRGQVIWIDEAGLLGAREMWEIMQVAGRDTRVILTGDSGQHAPVSRGDAFRLLQKYAGLKVAEVTEIRRQESETYKNAVAALSRGDLPNAFQNLDRIGAIVEIEDDASRYRQLASDYMELGNKGSPPLVVSPTHFEGAKVTEAIREAKMAKGQLSAERNFIRYQDLKWEEADKKRSENYGEGLVLQFHQNAKGIRRGEIFRINGIDESGTLQMKAGSGRVVPVPLQQAERFQVFEEREIRVGKGEQLRITRNGESADGRRLSNGNLVTVEKFKKNGNIVLTTGAELDARHGHFTHGYCQTSHSSQSKSVKDVLVAQSSDSFLASSREQFYVSVSRGKETIRIYTDSRRDLQEAVGNSSTRKSAVELAGITKGDISAMSAESGEKQWREAVKSRMAEGKEGAHVRNLMQARRQDVQSKASDMNWRQYVEMRRGLSSADGRSRSKGHPQDLDKKKGGNSAEKGRSFARPTQLSTATTERMKAAHEIKKGEGSEKKPETTAERTQEKKPEAKVPEAAKTEKPNRLQNGFKNAVSHFNRVVGRGNQDEVGKKAAEISKPQQPANPTIKGQDQSKVPDNIKIQNAEQGKASEKVKTENLAARQAQHPGKIQIQSSNLKQIADHRTKQRADDAGKAAQQSVKMAQQVQPVKAPPTPTPPTPKR